MRRYTILILTLTLSACSTPSDFRTDNNATYYTIAAKVIHDFKN